MSSAFSSRRPARELRAQLHSEAGADELQSELARWKRAMDAEIRLSRLAPPAPSPAPAPAPAPAETIAAAPAAAPEPAPAPAAAPLFVQAGAGQDVLTADTDDEEVEPPPPAAAPPPPAPPPAPAEAAARPLVRKESRATLVSARAATVARASEVVESSVCNPRQQKASRPSAPL